MGKEPSMLMLVPVGVMTVGTVLLGCFPGPLLKILEEIAGLVL